MKWLAIYWIWISVKYSKENVLQVNLEAIQPALKKHIENLYI